MTANPPVRSFDPPLTWDQWTAYARTKLPVCTPQQIEQYLARREAERNAPKKGKKS